ncbi:hypothetical protein SDC9_155617 [bioreactor metagenome]|uniref:Uncharacterized protein n=1 Tax=bioreactor metagenome TaxID=1076179 RepID=A0A645F203_9ZZZZ
MTARETADGAEHLLMGETHAAHLDAGAGDILLFTRWRKEIEGALGQVKRVLIVLRHISGFEVFSFQQFIINQPQQCGLSRAVVADNTDMFSAVHIEFDIL